MKGGIMKKYLLSLLMILTLLFIACGNEPPEEFYEGTPEDSTEIHNLLDQNSELLVGSDMFDPDYIPVTLDNVLFFVADSYYRNTDTIVKIHVDSCALTQATRDSVLDFWFAKDTTCTVYLYDTFSVTSSMHYDAKYTGYYFWSGDTSIELDTVIVDSTGGYDEQPVTGNGYRHIFFDWDETNGWQLKRISYGTYNFPAAGTDIPILDKVMFTYSDGTQDSIIRSSYDTLYTGHVMNRFRSIDSLLVVPDGETLGIDLTLAFGQVTDSMCVYYASCGGTNRVQLDGGSGSLVVTGSGLTNLYFESVVIYPYYYVVPEEDYKAQVWLIPVQIQ
jgi:hypothetical protein